MSEEKQFDYENEDKPFIIAYETSNTENSAFELIQGVSDTQREWMDKTHNRFAYRCLPLLAVNSIGWQIKCKFGFVAIWDGTPSLHGVKFQSMNDNNVSSSVLSHFGHGIITFALPWQFRTSRGQNLIVTGPMNIPKEHATPLSGLVETDWLPFTFTMNWQITTANVPVVFQPGEIICQFFPYPRGYIEKFTALTQNMSDNKSIHQEYIQWANSRTEVNRKISNKNIPTDERNKLWEKNYFKGTHKDGTKFEEHQVKINSCPFMKMPKAKEH